MDSYESLVQTISLTMGVAWASGINLYAAILVLGLGSNFGYIEIPPTLAVVEDPVVLLGAAGLYFTEFVADKIPGVDTVWDGLHTFVRIPAGAVLAAGAVGDVSPALETAAGLFGGTMAATSHVTKAGTRVLINTSPEPVTNWFASITEDFAVIFGLWAALNHPVVMIILLILFIALVAWLLPKIWRGVRFVFRKLGELFGIIKPLPPEEETPSTPVEAPKAKAAPPPEEEPPAEEKNPDTKH